MFLNGSGTGSLSRRCQIVTLLVALGIMTACTLSRDYVSQVDILNAYLRALIDRETDDYLSYIDPERFIFRSPLLSLSDEAYEFDVVREKQALAALRCRGVDISAHRIWTEFEKNELRIRLKLNVIFRPDYEPSLHDLCLAKLPKSPFSIPGQFPEGRFSIDSVHRLKLSFDRETGYRVQEVVEESPATVDGPMALFGFVKLFYWGAYRCLYQHNDSSQSRKNGGNDIRVWECRMGQQQPRFRLIGDYTDLKANPAARLDPEELPSGEPRYYLETLAGVRLTNFWAFGRER